MNDKKKLEDIAQALMGGGDELAKARAKRDAKAKERAAVPALRLVISGDGNNQIVTGNGSITNHTYHVSNAPIPHVIVQTGVGVIDAQQKSRLLELRDSVVEASIVSTTPKTPGGVMLALNKYMKVNKYAEIMAVDFDKAVKWLVRQRAIKTSLPSARKKLPSWRNARIRAVHSRCKEKGFETWRIDYMQKKFGKATMVDLSDDDLEALYRAVMGKK